jgi:hypothetical protein
MDGARGHSGGLGIPGLKIETWGTRLSASAHEQGRGYRAGG